MYLFPIRAGSWSGEHAQKVWGAVRKTTERNLRRGDFFFLHFAPGTADQIGHRVQLVQDGEDTLDVF